ncbi:MAG: hypothetical protein HY329_05355 [Chloroflexi bacterium]|nr:hypothetical protein [Chloroflexota bacterium]
MDREAAMGRSEGRPEPSPVAGEPGLERVDLAPCSAYELLTRSRLEEVAREVAEVRSRVNSLLYGLMATVLALLLERLVGR